jgi:hypothetical protein
MKTISIILYYIQAWIRLKRVHRFETTYGYLLCTYRADKHLRVYHNSADWITAR